MLTKDDLFQIKIIVNDVVVKVVNEVVVKVVNEVVVKVVNDVVYDVVNTEISNFAILMKKQFDRIESILETKADKSDLNRLEASVSDIDNRVIRIEGYILSHRNEIDNLRDDMRIVKTKLNIS